MLQIEYLSNGYYFTNCLMKWWQGVLDVLLQHITLPSKAIYAESSDKFSDDFQTYVIL